jgi:hypothetical protein
LASVHEGTEVMRRLRVTGPETEPPFQINDSWIHPRGVMEAWRERNSKERRGGSTLSRSVFKPSCALAALD